jgi:hypothetical protein
MAKLEVLSFHDASGKVATAYQSKASRFERGSPSLQYAFVKLSVTLDKLDPALDKVRCTEKCYLYLPQTANDVVKNLGSKMDEAAAEEGEEQDEVKVVEYPHSCRCQELSEPIDQGC